MRKGAIPVPYIVAIIFAIVVISLIAYMFFTHTGIFSGTTHKKYCEAKKLQYCWDWSQAGKSNPPKGGWSSYEPTCQGVVDEPTVEECSKLHITIPG